MGDFIILELNLAMWADALPNLGVFLELAPPDPWTELLVDAFLAAVIKDEVEGAFVIDANASNWAVVCDRRTDVDIACKKNDWKWLIKLYEIGSTKSKFFQDIMKIKSQLNLNIT